MSLGCSGHRTSSRRGVATVGKGSGNWSEVEYGVASRVVPFIRLNKVSMSLIK